MKPEKKLDAGYALKKAKNTNAEIVRRNEKKVCVGMERGTCAACQRCRLARIGEQQWDRQVQQQYIEKGDITASTLD
ncbi:MAG: hypothetical protein AAFP89_23290 [Bacteroidota bacterium]